MRNLSAVIPFLLPTRCAHWFGPADGFFYAVGSTPGNTRCQLSIGPVGGAGTPREGAVSGDFRESIILTSSYKGHSCHVGLRQSRRCNSHVQVWRHGSVASFPFGSGRLFFVRLRQLVGTQRPQSTSRSSRSHRVMRRRPVTTCHQEARWTLTHLPGRETRPSQ